MWLERQQQVVERFVPPTTQAGPTNEVSLSGKDCFYIITTNTTDDNLLRKALPVMTSTHP